MRIIMRFTLGITTKYIDRNPTASMTNNPPSGCHPSNHRVLSCEQRITVLSKVRKVNNYNMIGTVFWLIGANAPIMRIHFKCILKKIKKLNKKFWVCI
jgi:hypothetical protein